MERYKKRTIALCLASVLTVVGAFGAENYDNALMALKVNVGSGGYVNLTAFTEKPYKNNFKTSKLDDNTYVLTLYNTSNSAAEPDIEDFDNIESIEISTFPYTTESDGYTRVLVKTNGEPKLTASHALFIPDNLKNKFANSMTQDTKTSEVNYEEEQSSTSENTSAETSSDDSAATENDKEVAKNTFTPPDYTKVKTESNSFEHMTVILCISIILVIVGFIYMLSRDKMANVVGDQGDLDINDDTNDKKQSKTKKIRSTINKLDKAYQYKTDSVDFSYNKSEYTTSSDNTSAPVKKETEEENVVVDLDMLYQESQKTANAAPVNEYEENDDDDDLADLLNSFSFEEEKPAETEKEEESFDEELYNRVINSSKLSFTQSDIKKN